MTEEKWVLLARLVRPQGRKGEVLADLLTDFPERFSERKRVFLLPPAATKKTGEPCEMELEEHWLHKGRVVLKFVGIDSITDAETLRGMEVAIPHEERASLAGDEVYISELIGCRVFSGETLEDIGEITDVDLDSTAMPLLVVKRPRGDEVLIPFAKAFLKRLDIAARRVEMMLPEGLLEVNAPLTDAERLAQQQEAAAESDPENSENAG
jgi:16S rRNA processing protein RimM